MRFAYYAINGVGLGHLARTVAVARALDTNGAGEKHEHLFLTSSPAIEILRREGFPFVQFPSDTLISSKSLPLKDKTYSRILAGLVNTTLNAFDPHVFVVDTLPHGVRNELAVVTTSARRSAFILRERGDIDPATAAAMNGYDLILMPHAGPEVPAGIDASKVTHSGPIILSGDDGRQSPSAARETLGLAGIDKPLIGVAFGGGGDKRCAELLAWAASAASRHEGFHFVLSLPPLLKDDVEALSANVSTIAHSPLADVWPAFDIVVSAAGYNSANELLHSGVPTIFVPLERPLDDQVARARGFVQAGAALEAKAFDDDSLDTSIKAMESTEAREAIALVARRSVPVDGAANAARSLLDLAN